MKRQKISKVCRRILASALAACMGLSLAACGGKDGRVDPVKEWVYVPEFVTIEDDSVSYYEMRYSGDSIYYSSHEWDQEKGTSQIYLCRYSLADKNVTKVPLSWEGGNEESAGSRNIDNLVAAQDGGIYATVSSYTYDEKTQTGSSKWALTKFGADGKQIFYKDVTEQLKGQGSGDYVYINGFAVDGKGRMYAVSDSTVYLFDGEGAFKGSVSVGAGDSYLQSIGTGGDGKVYVCNYNWGGEKSSCELVEIDFDNAKTGSSYPDFPESNSQSPIVSGTSEDTLLVNDGRTLYEYSLSSKTKTALFDWLDSDINGDSVRSVGAMADGRVLAVIEDWRNDDSGIVFLTKTKGSEVAQKETILIGTIYNDYELQAAAVKFNRSSDKYHVSIRQYEEMTNLNNDLLSKTNCPDILNLSGLNSKQLAGKGLLEDLGQYLEKSSVLSREDFVESVLNAYTFDGTLACIPMYFELETIVGKGSDLGNKRGWTLQEMMDYADKHPDADLFDRMSKNTMMYYLLAYNESAFIDWKTGKCSFNSEEFKNLLAFANRFPTEIDYERGQASTPTRIQNGEVLLKEESIYKFDSIQIDKEIFKGDMTCIGFPAMDGSSGTMMAAYGTYGITTKATRKDGAWQFIESILQKSDSFDSWGFPAKKAELEKMAKEAVTVQYLTDENGNPRLDQDGKPIEIGVGGSMGYEDGWSYEYRRATQDEVDLVMELINDAKPFTMSQSKVLEIIDEEAAGYFAGQKDLDSVVKVIQSRIQNYVDEGN